MSISREVHSGVRWIGAGIAMTHIARFVTTAVLARLLAPELFGLVAMAAVTVQILGVLRQVGLVDAFVQRQFASEAEERSAAATMFGITLTLNGLLFVVIFFAAPWVASFFQTEGVTPVLRCLGAGLLIDALAAVPRGILRKRLAFDTIASATIAASLTQAAVAIPAALAGFEAWSLVAGQLASQLVSGSLVFVRAGWRPSLAGSREHAGALFSFGKFMWGFGILSAVGDSLDRVVIGRILGPASLGAYSVAYNLSRLPHVLMSNLVNQVSFPAFSKLQENREALQRAFLKAVLHVAILAIPVGFGIAALAEDLILIVYGDRWEASIPVIEILAFYGAALAVAAPAGPVFQATGRPHVLMYTSVLHHSLLITGLLSLAGYGVQGVATAVLLPMLVSATLSTVLVIRYLEMAAMRLLDPLARCALAGVVMFFGVRWLRAQLDGLLEWPRIPDFLIAVVGGALLYGAMTWLLNRSLMRAVSETVVAMIPGRRRAA